ncbi:MAG: sigma factor [Ruminococcus callidus]
MQPAKEKLHTLYKIYEKPMYHIAYAILHHTQQTEDAVSEVSFAVIANLHKIGDPESPQTRQYMIQIIRSTAISQYRKNARESDRRSPWDDKFLQIPEDAPPCPGTAGGTGDAAGGAGRDDGGPKRDRPEDRLAALSGKPLVPGDRPAVWHQGGGGTETL